MQSLNCSFNYSENSLKKLKPNYFLVRTDDVAVVLLFTAMLLQSC